MAVFSQRSSGRWQARIRRDGWPTQSKTFRTQADAQAWARAVEREMDIGAFIQRNDAERTTFKDAADRYAREVLPSKRSRVQDSSMLARLVERFGPYSLASISPALLSAFRDERLKAVSNQTVVHELGMISRVFKAAALDWGIGLPHGIPTALVRKPRVSNERVRRLEGNEKELLLEALAAIRAPWLHAAFVLAIETAGRQSELISLTWADVNLQRRVARLRGKDGGITKSGDPWRDVPLSPAACSLLAALPRSAKGLVLPISQNALQLGWKRLCARARKTHVLRLLQARLASSGLDENAQEHEIRAVTYKKREPLPLTRRLLEHIEATDTVMVGLHFHDLRHEATSVLAERLQMHELMKVTGHKSAKVLARYYHPRVEDLAAKLA